MEDAKNNDWFDFSDLNVGTDMFPAINGVIEASGVYDLTEDEFREKAMLQENARMRAAGLLQITNELVDQLEVVQSIEELKDAVDVYFEVELPDFAVEHGLTAQGSNVMKMMEGVRQEFGTFFPLNGEEPREERLQSAKMLELKRVLANLAVVLGMVKAEGNWEDLENGVPELLYMTGALDKDMGNLEVAITGADNRRQILGILNGDEGREGDSLSEKLERYSEGNMSLMQMQAEKKRWDGLKDQAETIISADPEVN